MELEEHRVVVDGKIVEVVLGGIVAEKVVPGGKMVVPG